MPIMATVNVNQWAKNEHQASNNLGSNDITCLCGNNHNNGQNARI